METKPIDILLYCPRCGRQHIDKPQPEKGWTNPPPQNARMPVLFLELETLGHADERGRVDPNKRQARRECLAWGDRYASNSRSYRGRKLMPVYVDDLADLGYKCGESCFLIADDLAELELFASELGLTRAQWYQDENYPCYVLSVRNRARALRKGAKYLNRAGFIKKTKELRGNKYETKNAPKK